ncbi:hypothetical protein JMM59_02410 [Rhodovulum sulfidophilum]|uniref:hypothetical protein n=1 Tax=Rhodovulum sulfidophilum TaxID=35806 RepID=UPI00192153D2|nr:hypothetical protein [Rhodovulum sulfidophilum]MBL3563873.1 hypothetical protein [Rhodovulum sulfidophilum]
MPGCIVTARHSLPALSPDPVTVGAAAVSFLVDPAFWKGTLGGANRLRMTLLTKLLSGADGLGDAL